ncbi:hypothetical protein BSKO_01842 [Bryopsis sp. KO-2023]|nr:hypothetical protein BSKO_01842 [Bryopsis sp. KO-2023]
MPLRFIVTGFSNFNGVQDNPTEAIVTKLANCVEQRGGIFGGAILEGCHVLKVAARQTAEFLTKQGEALCDVRDEVVWLHLGVNINGKCFEIEQQAVNNANFRVPDEDGWKPVNCQIGTTNGLTLESRLCSDLDTKALAGGLKKEGFNIELSDDAGTFICNQTYFASLDQSRQQGCGHWHSLFVHVPFFQHIGEEVQIAFVISLLDQIAMCCSQGISAAQEKWGAKGPDLVE